MRDGPRWFAPDSSCPALLRWRPCPSQRFAYGTLTLYGRRFHAARLRFPRLSSAAPTTPAGASPRPRFGLLRFRSPLLAESLLFSSPAGTEMFQFPALAPLISGVLADGLPHSDTRGSVRICRSPRFFSCFPFSLLRHARMSNPARGSVVFYSFRSICLLSRVHHVNDLPSFSWRITDSNR